MANQLGGVVLDVILRENGRKKGNGSFFIKRRKNERVKEPGNGKERKGTKRKSEKERKSRRKKHSN